MNDVYVISGASDGCFALGGKTARAIRARFVHVLSIPQAAVAYINGLQVCEEAILDPGDVLEFIVPNGVKAALDPDEAELLNRMAHQIDQLSDDPARFQRINLNCTEQKILATLGNSSMTGETLAYKAGYDFHGQFKATLAALVRHGLLVNVRGYSIPTDVKRWRELQTRTGQTGETK